MEDCAVDQQSSRDCAEPETPTPDAHRPQVQWNLISVNSRGPSEKVHLHKRNFTISVAICMGVIMLGDLKVVHIKQVFHFNRDRYNEVPVQS